MKLQSRIIPGRSRAEPDPDPGRAGPGRRAGRESFRAGAGLGRDGLGWAGSVGEMKMKEASAAGRMFTGAEPYAFFLAVFFPDDQVNE